MEVRVNSCWDSRRIDDPVWWVSWTNCWGGFLFFLGAAGGSLVDIPFGGFVHHDLLEIWVEIVPYLVGSILYLVASLLCLWLWKSEQYGLAMLRSHLAKCWLIVILNHCGYSSMNDWHAVTHPMHGKVGRTQFAVLIVLLLTATVAVMNQSISFVRWSALGGSWPGSRLLLSSTISLIEMLAFFLLFSFLHRSPKSKPLRKLIQLARVWICLRLVSECTSYVFFSTLLEAEGQHVHTHWTGFVS